MRTRLLFIINQILEALGAYLLATGLLTGSLHESVISHLWNGPLGILHPLAGSYSILAGFFSYMVLSPILAQLVKKRLNASQEMTTAAARRLIASESARRAYYATIGHTLTELESICAGPVSRATTATAVEQYYQAVQPARKA